MRDVTVRDSHTAVHADVLAGYRILFGTDILEFDATDLCVMRRGRTLGNCAHIRLIYGVFGFLFYDALAGATDQLKSHHEYGDQYHHKNIHHSPLRFIKSLGNIRIKCNRKTKNNK